MVNTDVIEKAALVLTLWQARRNQLIIAGISSVLLATLWAISDLPRPLNYALAPVVVALWIPVVLAHKQREDSLVWSGLFALLGLAVFAVVMRIAWLIGRG
jgi:branched-subunit amino acid transport protein